MDRDEIKQMALDSGMFGGVPEMEGATISERIERFAHLVEQRTREECALPKLQLCGSIERELATARGLASCRGDEDAIDEAERELAALREELATLRALAGRSLEARDKEANAEWALENARNNFAKGHVAAYERAYEMAMLSASEADTALLKFLANPVEPSKDDFWSDNGIGTVMSDMSVI